MSIFKQTFGTRPEEDQGSAYDNFMLPGAPLKLFRPKTDSVSTFIPIAEYEDGVRVPMVRSTTPAGDGTTDYTFSGVFATETAISSGTMEQFTGIVQPNDRDDLRAFNTPWTALYMAWRVAEKRLELSPHELMAWKSVSESKVKGHGAPLSTSSTTGFVQGYVTALNGKPLPQPTLGVVYLTASAVTGVKRLLKAFAQMGRDAYDPASVQPWILKGVPQDTGFSTFEVEPASPVQLPAVNQWTPWERLLRSYSYEQHLDLMLKSFPGWVFTKTPAFLEQMLKRKPDLNLALPQFSGAPQQPAVATSGMLPPGMLPPVQAAQPVPGMVFPAAQPVAPTAPAPVPGLVFPAAQPVAPTAPAPVPGLVFPAAQPVAPTAPAPVPGLVFPAVQAQPVAPAQPIVASAADLTASYNQIVAQMKAAAAPTDEPPF
jgi:hypothetical protein